MIVCSREALDRHGLTPMGRVVSTGTAGVDPTIMGIGPVPATRQALAVVVLAALAGVSG